MRVWRIARATRTYGPDDLSGKGASIDPGRWNDAGVAIVYCAENRSLAVLETLVHVAASGFPGDRFLVAIDIPDAAWNARESLDQRAADRNVPTWNSIPAAAASARHGSSWQRSKRSAVLSVPSVIVPEERVVLLNPDLISAASIGARIVRKVDYSSSVRGPMP